MAEAEKAHLPDEASGDDALVAAIEARAAAAPLRLAMVDTGVRTDVMQALMPAPLLQTGTPAADSAQAATEEPALAEQAPIEPVRVEKAAVWREVRRINALVNRNIRPATDMEIYGVEERWAMPLSDGDDPYGDCEDYALEKRRMLLDAGVPPGAMFFAVGTHPVYGRHLVLIVSTDGGDYVLDNLTPWILTWDAAPYHWRTRQIHAYSRDWVQVAEMPELAVLEPRGPSDPPADSAEENAAGAEQPGSAG